MIDDFDARLTQKLMQSRQRRGWSLADLAERSGVSKAMLSRIERGEASPTAALLARIASAFEATLAAFLTFEDQGERRLRRRASDQPVWRDPQTDYTAAAGLSRMLGPASRIIGGCTAAGRRGRVSRLRFPDDDATSSGCSPASLTLGEGEIVHEA